MSNTNVELCNMLRESFWSDLAFRKAAERRFGSANCFLAAMNCLEEAAKEADASKTRSRDCFSLPPKIF